MDHYVSKLGNALRASVLGVVLVLAGAAAANAMSTTVSFSFSVDALSGAPFDVSGTFSFDAALTGVINGNQFLSESLSIQQGGVDLPTVENYLARFRWDIDNEAIRAPNDTINSAVTEPVDGSYFLNYAANLGGFKVWEYAGAAFPRSVGIPVPQDGLALDPPFTYTVTTAAAVPEPGTVFLFAMGLTGLFLVRWRAGERR